jgi:hypothetical protein
MSLLFIDGCDHYAAGDALKKYSAAGGIMTSTTAGRRGGGAIGHSTNSGGYITKSFLPANTVIIGFGMYMLGNSNNSTFLLIGDSSASHIRLNAISGNYIAAYRENFPTLIGTTALPVLTPLTYNYIEVKCRADAVTGFIEIRVNGGVVLTLNNINTKGSSALTSAISAISLFTLSAGTWFDDIYICDNSGTMNNDYLGDIRIDTIYPNADGTYTDLAPDTGTTRFSRVNEAVLAEASYVSGSTDGAKNTYQFGDLALGTNLIKGVQVTNTGKKMDAGFRTMANLVKSGASLQESTPKYLADSTLMLSTIHEKDPATNAAWTNAAINAAEFGTKIGS